MIFACERLASRDGEGLESVGVRWTEARAMTEQAMYKAAEGVMLLGIVVAVCGAGFAAGLVIAAGLVLVPIGLLLVRASVYVSGRERELSFWRDGLIYAPLGLGPWPWGATEAAYAHSDVRSIEAEQLVQKKKDDDSPYTHGVRIFFYGGQVLHIAKDLEPDHAHTLAVTLTHALSELRQSLSSDGRKKMRARETVID